MLTKAEIAAASSTLDSIDIEMWLALIRANPTYRANVVLFPDVESELDNASGDTKGKMLNALSAKIQELGVGEVEIKNGDEGLNYSQSLERDALVEYALSILFPVVTTVVVTDTTTGSFGDYQVRQRSWCSYCGCLVHSRWCRYYAYY